MAETAIPQDQQTAPLGEGVPESVVGSPEWAEGQVLDGLYEVKRKLGEGGMGVVWLVHHRNWDVDLAVKSPSAGGLAAASGEENFVREAETWVNLPLHPNVVQCFYVRKVGDRPRIFAEYCDGGSAQDWIAQGRFSKPEAALDIAIQICWGMAHAHRQGLVHRDLKPANVLMARDGSAKVTDFGLARKGVIATEADTEEALAVAQVSMTYGTPGYAAPEQMREGGSIDRRADVFAFGVSLWSMLGGPIAWGSRSAVAKLSAESILKRRELGDLPSGLADLILRCLDPYPDERWPDLASVGEKLKSIYREAAGQEYGRTEPVAADLLADGLNNRAISMLDLGKADEAERLLSEALRAQAEHPEATYNLGLMRWRAGRQTDEALLDAMRAVENGVEDRDAWRNLRAAVNLERGAAAKTERQRGTYCIQGFKQEEHPASALAFSPDGESVAVGTETGSVLLWTPSAREAVRLFSESGSLKARSVNLVEFVNEGKQVLAARVDGTVALCDTSGKTAPQTWQMTRAVVTCAATDRASGKALLGDDLGNLYVLSPPSYEPNPIRGFTFRANAASLYEGGAKVLLARQNEIHGYNLTTQTPAFDGMGHDHELTCMAVTPDGRNAFAGDANGGVSLWDLATGTRARELLGHGGRVNSVVWLTPDRYAASAGNDRKVMIWDVTSGRCLRTLQVHKTEARALAASPEHARLATADAGGAVRVWSFDPAPLATAPFQMSRPRASATVSQAEQRFRRLLDGAAAAAADDPAEAYRLLREAMGVPGFGRSPHAMAALSGLAESGKREGIRDLWESGGLKGEELRFTSVAVSADGRLAATAGISAPPQMWDLREGARLWMVDPPPDPPIGVVAISPDGARSALADVSDNVTVLEPESGAALSTSEKLPARVTAMAFTSDGSALLAGDETGGIHWADADIGRVLTSFSGYASGIQRLCVSPDGLHFCTVDLAGKVLLWDRRCRQPVRKFADSKSQASAAAFSPAGGLLAIGDEGGAIALWRIRENEEAVRWVVDGSPIRGVAFSPEGPFVFGATAGGSIGVWRLVAGQEGGVGFAEERLTRSGAGRIAWMDFAANGMTGVAANHQGGLTSAQLDWNLSFDRKSSEDETRGFLPGENPWSGLNLAQRRRRNASHRALSAGRAVSKAFWMIPALYRNAAVIAALLVILGVPSLVKGCVTEYRAQRIVWEMAKQLPESGPEAGGRARKIIFWDTRYKPGTEFKERVGVVEDQKYRTYYVTGIKLRKYILIENADEIAKAEKDADDARAAQHVFAAKEIVQTVARSGNTETLTAMMEWAKDDILRVLIAAVVAYTPKLSVEEMVLPVLRKAVKFKSTNVNVFAKRQLRAFEGLVVLRRAHARDDDAFVTRLAQDFKPGTDVRIGLVKKLSGSTPAEVPGPVNAGDPAHIFTDGSGNRHAVFVWEHLQKRYITVPQGSLDLFEGRAHDVPRSASP